MNRPLYPTKPVLLIDDEPSMLMCYDTALRINGINHIITTSDSRKVMPLMAEREVAAVFLDLVMPHLTGEELLISIAKSHPEVPVIVVTGLNLVGKAVECMKAGAFDYLVKPIEANDLWQALEAALAFRRLQLGEQPSNRELKQPHAFENIVTNDEKMHALFHYIEAIAPTYFPVLITGETGTGKELVARAIHAASGFKGKFVAVNVAGLDESLFTDTIFGHHAGAYTGAQKDRAGLIEAAADGTLLLDEIGDLPAALQVKLLRLLEEREYLPLGSHQSRISRARIVVSTNRMLESMIRSGGFREDLFFRLRTHRIYVPPLRERMADLSLLLDHFLTINAKELGKKKPTTTPQLLQLLSSYHFPGNVRELQAMVRDAVSIHNSGVMSLDSFIRHLRQVTSTNGMQPKSEGQTEKFGFGDTLPTIEEVKQQLIEETLKRCGGNMRAAAEILGITRQGLSAYLAKKKKPE